jgi:tRNA G18 (ribose-2'-O)-methylase SpoU
MSLSRGYFAFGVEGISKAGNLGNLMRSAHSFGASYFFTINPDIDDHGGIRATDTSASMGNIPYFEYDSFDNFMLPQKCEIVAVELVDDSIDLPSFRHPRCAAYVLGPEMGNVSPEMMAIADHVIKIPMKFCVNVGVAGAIVMYDRLMSLGKFPPRPAKAGGPTPEEIASFYPMKQVTARRKIRGRKSAAEGK